MSSHVSLYIPKLIGYVGLTQERFIMEEKDTAGSGARKGYTQFTTIRLINPSIKGKKSTAQTRTGLPRVHKLLATHSLCLIELSVCTSGLAY